MQPGQGAVVQHGGWCPSDYLRDAVGGQEEAVGARVRQLWGWLQVKVLLYVFEECEHLWYMSRGFLLHRPSHRWLQRQGRVPGAEQSSSSDRNLHTLAELPTVYLAVMARAPTLPNRFSSLSPE